MKTCTFDISLFFYFASHELITLAIIIFFKSVLLLKTWKKFCFQKHNFILINQSINLVGIHFFLYVTLFLRFSDSYWLSLYCVSSTKYFFINKTITRVLWSCYVQIPTQHRLDILLYFCVKLRTKFDKTLQTSSKTKWVLQSLASFFIICIILLSTYFFLIL